MAKWKVWNKHPLGYTHKEKFREEVVEIKAGEYVVMDYEDAVLFRGQFMPMKKRPDGTDDPHTFKVIKIEPHSEQDAAPVEKKLFVCQLDGKKFDSQAALDAYVSANYADRVFSDETLDKEIAESKRKPGRPAKDKSA